MFSLLRYIEKGQYMIHPQEWPAYIKWRIQKFLKRIRQFVA
jgi:hypothetical protein